MRVSWPSSLLFPPGGGTDAPQRNLTLATGVCLVTALAVAPLFGWALAGERWSVVALLAALVLVPVIVRWPVVSAFGLYVFLVPFDSVAVIATAGGATMTRLAGVLAGAILLSTALIERRLVRPPVAALWWTLFLAWAALSVTWAVDPGLVTAGPPSILSLFLLYLVAVSVRPSERELYAICLLVVASGVVAASLGYFLGVEEVAEAGARGRLVLGERTSNPNTFGTVLILPFALALAGFAGLRSVTQKLLALSALGAIAAGVYISASRGALLAVVVTLVVFAARYRARWALAVPLALLLAVAAAMPETSFTRISRVFTGEDTTGAGRTHIWSVAVASLEQFGLLGTGYDNYKAIYRFSDAAGATWAPAPHNTYLGTWVELGVVGLLLMLAALVTALIAGRGISRTGLVGTLLSGVEAASAGMLAGAFFADRLGSKSFWLLWILLAWAVRVARERSDAPGSG